MDLQAIEDRVGFHLMQPTLKNIALMDTKWVEGFTDYYGKFSDGIVARYKYGNDTDTFFVIDQYKIISSDTPEVFSYPESVRAYQKHLNNGEATIVLIPDGWLESALPFVQWVVGDYMVLVLFYWAVDDITVESIINSLQSTLQ